eukprot:11951432-Alexandrium_andersonii.AAC.1
MRLKAIRRLARYLPGLPRRARRFARQGAQQLQVFADADWAGRPATRWSTSGGRALRGTRVPRRRST